jgi:hypothetical protein
VGEEETVLYRSEIDELAESLLVEHLWSYIFETACNGRVLFFRGIEVLDAARLYEMDVGHFPESM